MCVFWFANLLTLSQTSSDFLHVCRTSLLKTRREMEKLLITSKFYFSHSVIYSFGKRSIHPIQKCLLPTLPFWKSLKFVVWERVIKRWILDWPKFYRFGDMVACFCHEIAIMIILENYHDKTNFPGNSIEIAKCFTINILRYFYLLSHFFTLVPTSDTQIIYNQIHFRIIFAILYSRKLPSSSEWWFFFLSISRSE